MKKLWLLSLVLLLSACASTTPRTSIDYDPAVDFSQLRTYSWLDHDLAKQGVSPLVVSRIVAGVDAQLQAKGWTRAPEGQVGQVVIAAGVSVQQQQSVNTYYNAPMYAGYGWGGPWSRTCAGCATAPAPWRTSSYPSSPLGSTSHAAGRTCARTSWRRRSSTASWNEWTSILARSRTSRWGA